MKKAEIIVSMIFIIFSSVLLNLSRSFPSPKGNDVGCSFFPRTLSIFLILLSLLLLFNSIKKDKNHSTQDSNDPYALIRVLIVIILTVAYRYVIDYIGFLILTPFYLIILMLLIKVENIKKSIVLSVSITMFIWLAFYYLLQMPLPNGILF